jgi:hypothetical protein
MHTFEKCIDHLDLIEGRCPSNSLGFIAFRQMYRAIKKEPYMIYGPIHLHP